MLYDMKVTPGQLKAAAEHVETGDGMADVLLRVDGDVLRIAQGEWRVAINPDADAAEVEA